MILSNYRNLSALVLLMALSLIFNTVKAQSLSGNPVGGADPEEPSMNIVEHIMDGTGNVVLMPEAMREQIIFNDNAVETKNKNSRVGYRVQVFSDNNARTAKNEARSKSRVITERFPEYPTYVIFASPYWRLRVGDFRTQDEARQAAQEIKRAFPSFGKEVHVVRDRINLH